MDRDVVHASSYGINFVITLSECPFFATEEQLLKFVNHFTEFCLDSLPNEIDDLLSREDAPNSQFQTLFSQALELAPILAKSEEDLVKRTNEFKEDLRKDVLAVPPLLGPVAEIIQNSYGSLEIDNENLPLGTVDEDFSASLHRILAKLNEETVDSKIRTFRIRMYSYNKQTGKGRADVLINDEVSQILVHVVDLPLDAEEVNPYIESMRTDNYISVPGQMTYHAKRPYRLAI